MNKLLFIIVITLKLGLSTSSQLAKLRKEISTEDSETILKAAVDYLNDDSKDHYIKVKLFKLIGTFGKSKKGFKILRKVKEEEARKSKFDNFLFNTIKTLKNVAPIISRQDDSLDGYQQDYSSVCNSDDVFKYDSNCKEFDRTSDFLDDFLNGMAKTASDWHSDYKYVRDSSSGQGKADDSGSNELLVSKTQDASKNSMKSNKDFFTDGGFFG